MPAGEIAVGPALDSEVARVVFGWEVKSGMPGTDATWVTNGPHGIWRQGPSFSTNIAAAWTVVEKLLEMQPAHEDIHIEHLIGCGWKVSSCLDQGQWTDWVAGKTVPEAICRAALKAVEQA